ncbi:acyl-CoA dehydratase activase [Thermoanaerobacter brockii subsp. lactiethylicus]|uniref:acyl-CoA dehydratase activase n=1 Tax=Thermoanaerobacter sp. (strain X514) TaxID=399726 RepID=UPI0000E1D938|nr:acyl-CoA dehydratase activase [Thermoanaerobacter sp. X514]ABY91568.1 putative CoA-substrate-specific enzyme activase [Thermoanaerobacter sp. X514]
MEKIYIGVDVGSVSIKVVAIDENNEVLFNSYVRNVGQPIDTVKDELAKLHNELATKEIGGVGVTGSGRQLLGYILGADVIKNEITAHATATLHFHPDASTIFEIGGQDSKLIIINDGTIADFAMNTVCAAGTGSFLDHQAQRLGIKIEEFGEIALTAKRDVRIAGRCTVFAESDMISKQQYGFSKAEILKGLSKALVRNYMNNLVRGRKLKPVFVFQGGVAANIAIKKAFEEEVGHEVIVPKYYDIMGAIGIAMLAKDEMKRTGNSTKFKGFEVSEEKFETTSFICKACPNECEIIQIKANGKVIAMTGDRCGRWSNSVI